MAVLSCSRAVAWRRHAWVRAGAVVVCAAVMGLVGCGGSETIGDEELAALPPIVVVAADPAHAASTAVGNLYLLQPGKATLRLLKAWPDLAAETSGRPYGASAARWSPDRARIGFSLATWDGDPYLQVAVVASAGGAVERLTEPAGHSVLAWTPDGRALIFREVFGVGNAVRTVAVDGGAQAPYEPAAVKKALALSDDGPIAPSRDGARLAADGLFVVEVATLAARHLTKGKGGDPVWSADGRRLAYTLGDETANVFAVASDGSDERQLTTDGVSSAAGWSPDGTKVLFLRSAESEEGSSSRARTELWVMDADGGRQTRLAANEAGLTVLEADWGPPLRP